MKTTARVLLNGIIGHFGCPLTILSDQGGNYESQIFQKLCELLEIRKTRGERFGRVPSEIIFGSITWYSDQTVTEYGTHVENLRDKLQASHCIARKN